MAILYLEEQNSTRRKWPKHSYSYFDFISSVVYLIFFTSAEDQIRRAIVLIAQSP